MSVAILGKGKKVALKRRHARIRKRISGTPERPRLVVTRSNRHMVAQVVDDTKGITLVSPPLFRPTSPASKAPRLRPPRRSAS